MEANENDFVSISSSQESLLRRNKFVEEDNEDDTPPNDGYTHTHGADGDLPLADSTPILMVSPPTSSERNDVATPNVDVFQTPPEDTLPHSDASDQAANNHQKVADQNLGIGLSQEKTKECEEASVRVSEKEPAGPPGLLPPNVGGSEMCENGKRKLNARKKMKIPLREVVRAIVQNCGETEEDRKIERLSYADIAKLNGMKFP